MYRANNTKQLLIICPGLVFSKNGVCFLLSSLAKRLYTNDYNVVLFDYTGQGDSNGDYRDISLSSIYSSFEEVYRYYSDIGYNSFILIGYGIGNSICMRYHGCKHIDFIGLIDFDIDILYFKESILKQIEELPEYFEEEITVSDFGRLMRTLVGITPWYRYHPVSKELIIDFFYQLEQMGLKVCNKTLFEITVFADQRNKNAAHFHCEKFKSLDWKYWDEFTEWPVVANKLLDFIIKSFISDCPIPVDSVFKPAIRFAVNERVIPICIKWKKDTMLGIIHVPNGIPGKRYPCIIYEPGLGGDRTDHFNSGVLLGRVASDNNICLVRYDFTGVGLSEGSFDDYNWDRRKEQFSDLVKSLHSLTYVDENQIYVVSFSEGAKLALIAAQCHSHVRGIVMWSPIIRQLERIDHMKLNNKKRCKFNWRKSIIKMPQGLVIPLQGHYLKLSYLNDSDKHHYIRILQKLKKNTLIIYGVDDVLFDRLLLQENVNNCISSIGLQDVHLFGYKNMINSIHKTINWVKAATSVT